MLAVCHMCNFIKFDSDDNVNQTINSPRSIMYITSKTILVKAFLYILGLSSVYASAQDIL